MYIKTLLLTAVLAASPAAMAGDTVAELARETGLSERNVRMLLGPRTPYPEYRCCYDRKLRQFKQALGEENYQRLVQGKPMLREAPVKQARATGGTGEDAERTLSAP